MIKHKKVELTELFYDLVYVYAISQTTSLIYQLDGGRVSFFSFIIFALAMIMLINTWMIQTVFTNRYGRNSLSNIIAMILQMSFLLISSKVTTTVDEWEMNFHPFILAFVGVTAIQLWQYYYEHTRMTTRPLDRIMTNTYLIILFFRLVFLSISVFLPAQIGVFLAIFAIIFSWLLPLLYSHSRADVVRESERLTRFSHLLERLSLLVIIMFGESIINIANVFDVEAIDISSFLLFGIVANLFLLYIVEVDYMIEKRRKDTGIPIIYNHYLIFFGISFFTVGLSFLSNPGASSQFTLLLFGLGELLFLTGIIFNNPYHKFVQLIPVRTIVSMYVIAILGIGLACLAKENYRMVVLILFLSTLLMDTYLIRFYVGQKRLRFLINRIK